MVQIGCMLDLLLLVAVSVYHVSPVQLTVLMLTKLLAQDTVEALAYRSVWRGEGERRGGREEEGRLEGLAVAVVSGCVYFIADL